ncbi:MAG: energy-coupling factor ABC transporter substrate-binding protein [Kurthia gibsonii]|uniref:Cobalt transport protein CbiN n=1 Tax=Kurthia gibsonii TaxID=33946 RepID=A0ABU9LQ49_9BACL|nr:MULTISPECIES: energy-coupling factor ABC transporter substrate-binding protein [Kurthia]AMA62293.1 cobalt transport family protein [Kurthia sp. 11kri321]MEB6114020.1 energy-coupling factor ABC transporter substrate-binding protein [Kurthia gibsonii]MEB7770800.1 energy-coupling factor ABC transporter substrate-binding protein [Kurthia gibsonii]WIL39788.1 energy-coupling factor ABC transporter substrate-binding protein [Kurthia sp. YJT4]GED20085.1 cobalt transport protein CbiN [Kurthia gibson
MKKNLFFLFIVIALAIFPLFIQKGAEFGGADGEAEAAITEIDKSYEPWFSSIWEPPSGEIESLLFALQAAIGAGFIGYFFGLMRGRTKKEKVSHDSN